MEKCGGGCDAEMMLTTVGRQKALGGGEADVARVQAMEGNAVGKKRRRR